MAVRSRYRRDAEHFVVVTPFEWNGRRFVEGSAFPWRELGLVEFQLRSLWVSNKIDVSDAPIAAPPPVAADPPRPKRARGG